MPKEPLHRKRSSYYPSVIAGVISGVIVEEIGRRLAHPLAATSFVLYGLIGAAVGLASAVFLKLRHKTPVPK